MTLEQLQAQKEQIEANIFRGVSRSSFEDSSVEYFSITDQERALARVNAQIAALQQPNRSRIFPLKANRGI